MPFPPEITRLAAGCASLKLLVLYGSRGRGDFHEGSDWDFGFLAAADFDPLDFSSQLSKVLRTDDFDLADLASAGGLLRYRAALDGVLVYERRPGAFHAFCLEAARFWYDAGPILDRAYQEVLKNLGRPHGH